MASPWHKYDGINTMAQKGAKAPNDTAPSMRPGGGGRFQKLEGELADRPGVRNPGALAASIGRKKFGAAKMGAWSAKGKGGC